MRIIKATTQCKKYLNPQILNHEFLKDPYFDGLGVAHAFCAATFFYPLSDGSNSLERLSHYSCWSIEYG